MQHRERFCKDLPIVIEANEITSSLEEQGITNCKVTQLKTTRPTRFDLEKGIKSVPVEISNASVVDKFLAIKYICGLKIKIEKFKPPNGPPQCHRCQQYGHVDKACHMPIKCVKCGLDHLSRECNKPISEPAICANCKGNHPANYRGCPAYQVQYRSKPF
ncbi:hypothetical protein J437_LFUL013775 [Ladona fulva]|uniref:Gag-like protein n=1 Tax=Ladona fulva TaxID=123851 RepID=A0A8K0KEA3_LADFU|nr:hypothetical protein J437_LFUL013775 [Ladona fulva]